MLETILKPTDVAERCGYVLTDGTIVELTNVAADPVAGYEMDPVAALEYVRAGTIATTWHTHPGQDPTLSGADHEGFRAWPDFTHAIIGVRDGKNMVITYRVEDGLVITCD